MGLKDQHCKNKGHHISSTHPVKCIALSPLKCSKTSQPHAMRLNLLSCVQNDQPHNYVPQIIAEFFQHSVIHTYAATDKTLCRDKFLEHHLIFPEQSKLLLKLTLKKISFAINPGSFHKKRSLPIICNFCKGYILGCYYSNEIYILWSFM